MRKAAIIFLLFSLWSCKPDPIPEPIAAQLLAPVNLDNCSTADKINNNESQVSFLWSTALHTDDYELVIRNQSTGILIRRTTLLTSLNQILQRGSSYSWWVISRSEASDITSKSEVRYFYLEGETEQKHAPFPANLEFPEENAVVSLSNNTITFEWEGSDLDNDIAHYDLYVGTEEETISVVAENITQRESEQQRACESEKNERARATGQASKREQERAKASERKRW